MLLKHITPVGHGLLSPTLHSYGDGAKTFRLPVYPVICPTNHAMPFIELEKQPEKEQIKGFYGRAIHTGAMSFLYWSVEAGASIPMHSHMHEQVAHVLKGNFQLTIGDETRVLEPGLIAVIPPHVPHGGHAVTDCELLDVFLPERDDYKW